MEEMIINKYENILKRVTQSGAIISSTIEEFEKEYYSSKEEKRALKLRFVCPECGEIFERILSNIYKKDREKVCKECLKTHKRERELERNRINVIKKINDKGLTVVDIKEYRYETDIIRVICECGNIFRTSYASIRNSGKTVKCKECKKKNLRIKNRIPFEEIQSMYKNEGCTLLSKEKDYANIFSEMKHIAKCGHEHISTIQSFKNAKFKVCGDCAKNVHTGENAYNWKGGTYNSESEKFRKSYEFKQWQIGVFRRDNYMCQCCGRKKNINAHHLDGYNWCKEKRVDIDNGITLCDECHKMFHHLYGYGNNTKDQYEEFIKGKGRKSTYNIILN